MAAARIKPQHVGRATKKCQILKIESIQVLQAEFEVLNPQLVLLSPKTYIAVTTFVDF